MPKHLIAGLRRFRGALFPHYAEHYRRLVADGQRPSTLFLGCADSRVVPELLTDSTPGDLFILRNVGALVPPYDEEEVGLGVAAGIEFATLNLGVQDIVVCGHSHCGAMRALYEPRESLSPRLARWLDLAREVALEGPLDESTQRRTEQRSIVLQLERVLSYPIVRERVEAGALALHGWYYVIEEGRVHALDVSTGEFEPLS